MVEGKTVKHCDDRYVLKRQKEKLMMVEHHVTDREMAALGGIQMPPMKFYFHVVHPRKTGKSGITMGWPIDDTGAMMAAAIVEAVLKKMPMKWGQVIGSAQFKQLIGDDEQMASLFKTVAENKDVLKQPFKATAKKGKKAPEEKKSRKRRESYAKEICQVLQQTCEGTGVSEPVLEILNSFVHDLFERIAGEASKLAFYERRSCIQSREIQTAVELLLPSELAKEVVLEGNKAVCRYNDSK